MDLRRKFLKSISTGTATAAGVVLSSEILRADVDRGTLLGSWSSVHSLPFPPGSFREFISFAEGGVFHETNSFLNTGSNLDLSFYGLPTIVNAADGVGNWESLRDGAVQVVFRKMLFDSTRQHFGDMRVTGIVRKEHANLAANWQIEVLNLLDQTVADLGEATSQGVRLR